MLVAPQQEQSIRVVVVAVAETPLVETVLQQQVVTVVKDLTHHRSWVNRLVRHTWQVVVVVVVQPLTELVGQVAVVTVETITAQPILVAVVVAVQAVMAVLAVRALFMFDGR
jgi:hypothetical protein